MRILKVLIAEADPLLQKLYSDLIAEENAFTVLKCVSTGPQMFETLRIVGADLVLLDLYLKDFNALEGLDELRKEFPRLDYIIASSGENPELVRNALCQGVFEFLIKPFSFERLRLALRNYHVYHHSLTGRTRPWQQEDLDTLISMKARDPSWANNRSIPKGLQLKCLNDVESFLKESSDTFSAQEVGDKLGISRSTARRYLEFLTMSERVVVEYAYRRVGRPEKRYRMALL
ncbi:response regulator [Synergistaceae bacterium OttesenSCG-928-D05]|nr:response regulator [Synergistaceae bacterium OttesenSCG-928-D05]